MAKKNKDVIIGNDAREALAVGISKTVEAVGTTLGPKGQNVLIDSGHPAAPSTITKDGVTVLRNLVLNDAIENLELVSRKEWVLRHSIHRYPEEMKKTFKILGKINKKIQKHEHN